MLYANYTQAKTNIFKLMKISFFFKFILHVVMFNRFHISWGHDIYPTYNIMSFHPSKTGQTYQNEGPNVFAWQEQFVGNAERSHTSIRSRHVNRLNGRLRLEVEAKKNRTHSNTAVRNIKYWTACLTEHIHVYASVHASDLVKWDIMALRW